MDLVGDSNRRFGNKTFQVGNKRSQVGNRRSQKINEIHEIFSSTVSVGINTFTHSLIPDLLI